MGDCAAAVAVGRPEYHEIVEWLYREAELLDDIREREWLEEMVHQDVVYQIPLRQTLDRGPTLARGQALEQVPGPGFVAQAYHLNESYGSLACRVARNESPSAWTEDPPPRTRRFVSNIRATELGDGCLAIRSNLLVYRTRQDQTEPHLLAGERHDVLRREDVALRLSRRVVLLDHSVLGIPNLSYFL